MSSYINNYIKSYGKNRIALVGANSQGKSYQLNQLAKDKDIEGKVIYVESETKPDENMKNSTDTATLIDWVTSLIGTEELNKVVDNTIEKIKIDNNNSKIKVELKNCVKTFKGLLELSITTGNNSKNLTGSGERVLGQLIIIDNILKDGKNDDYEYLIVDEPEAHLHPSLYYLIAKTLKSISEREIKVVIATHSEEILKFFVEDSDEIIMMKDLKPNPLKSTKYYYEIGKKIKFYLDEKYIMSSYKMIINKDFHYFEKIMLDGIYSALFSNIALLGEGVIETEFYNLYKDEFYDVFYNENISIVITYGKVMMPWYIDILNDIGIKTICMYDKDNEDNYIQKELNNYIKTEANDYIELTGETQKSNNMEGYLGIYIKERDKGKYNITELRYMYINREIKLINLLNIINKKITNLE